MSRLVTSFSIRWYIQILTQWYLGQDNTKLTMSVERTFYNNSSGLEVVNEQQNNHENFIKNRNNNKTGRLLYLKNREYSPLSIKR